jgi:hypothetical protein
MAMAQDNAQPPAAEQPDAPKRVVCPLNGGSFSQMRAVATLLVSQGNLAAAEACLQDGVATTIVAFQELSELAAERGAYMRASAFSGILETLSGSADARLYHSRRLLQSGQPAQARVRLEALKESNPGISTVHHMLGVSQFQLGSVDDGIASVKRASELAPETKLYSDDLQAMMKTKGEGEELTVTDA